MYACKPEHIIQKNECALFYYSSTTATKKTSSIRGLLIYDDTYHQRRGREGGFGCRHHSRSRRRTSNKAPSDTANHLRNTIKSETPPLTP